jgi:hypothetical protein
MTDQNVNQDQKCCDLVNPADWDEKEFNWQGKLFIKDRVRSFLHIPLNFGQVVIRNMKKIEAAGVKGEQLMLVDENSPWGADVYLAVKGEVPGAEMVPLSGIFLTRIFDGPFNMVPRWLKEMRAYLVGKGKKAEKVYFSYTACPACSKKFGHNYVVLFAKIG